MDQHTRLGSASKSADARHTRKSLVQMRKSRSPTPLDSNKINKSKIQRKHTATSSTPLTDITSVIVNNQYSTKQTECWLASQCHVQSNNINTQSNQDSVIPNETTRKHVSSLNLLNKFSDTLTNDQTLHPVVITPTKRKLPLSILNQISDTETNVQTMTPTKRKHSLASATHLIPNKRQHTYFPSTLRVIQPKQCIKQPVQSSVFNSCLSPSIERSNISGKSSYAATQENSIHTHSRALPDITPSICNISSRSKSNNPFASVLNDKVCDKENFNSRTVDACFNRSFQSTNTTGTTSNSNNHIHHNRRAVNTDAEYYALNHKRQPQTTTSNCEANSNASITSSESDSDDSEHTKSMNMLMKIFKIMDRVILHDCLYTFMLSFTYPSIIES